MKANPAAKTTLVIAAVLLLGAAALARPGATSPRDPKACAPGADSHLKMPDSPAPPTSGATTGSGTNLSDKLAQSGGVICPPNVDPGIKAPTPDVGKMPIIPPPGSPGGDQSKQPK